MSAYQITLVSSLSILLPFAAGIRHFSELGKKYNGLFILLCLGLINELFSITLVNVLHNNATNGNIYVLLEFFLILWLFANLSDYLSGRFILSFLSLALLIWIIDNLVLHSVTNNNSLFRMLASLGIVYLSMDKINHSVFFGKNRLFKSTDLLICLAFFLYFSCKTYLEVFNVFSIPVSLRFYETLWTILAVINVLSNILLMLAILCLRQKTVSIIPSLQD